MTFALGDRVRWAHNKAGLPYEHLATIIPTPEGERKAPANASWVLFDNHKFPQIQHHRHMTIVRAAETLHGRIAHKARTQELVL